MEDSREGGSMGFMDHLEELRKRLFYSVLAIAAGAISLFVAKDWVFETVLFAPRKLDFIAYRGWCALSELVGAGDTLCVTEIGYELITTTMAGAFTAHMLVSVVGGLIVAFPFVFLQGWRFIKPALREEERKVAAGVTWAASGLFFTGVLFGYFIVAPLSLQFFGNYTLGDVEARIAVMSYVKTVASISLGSGLVFQLPVAVYFLARLGLVTADFLRTYRRHAFVANLVFAAVITPPDVVSQVLVAIPIVILYEASIFIAARARRT
jgi:sec-independent protein translocase protein TatC